MCVKKHCSRQNFAKFLAVIEQRYPRKGTLYGRVMELRSDTTYLATASARRCLSALRMHINPSSFEKGLLYLLICKIFLHGLRVQYFHP